MALSGSKDFELDVTEYIEEAFERCGLVMRTGYDLKTAKRSMNLLFADWANRGLNQWTIEQVSIALADGIAEYPAGTLTMTQQAPVWLLPSLPGLSPLGKLLLGERVGLQPLFPPQLASRVFRVPLTY